MNRENFEKAQELNYQIDRANTILQAVTNIDEASKKYGGNYSADVKVTVGGGNNYLPFSIPTEVLCGFLKKYANAEIKKLNAEFVKL